MTGDRAGAAELFDMGAALGAAIAPTIGALCLAEHAMISIELGDWEGANDLAERGRKIVADNAV